MEQGSSEDCWGATHLHARTGHPWQAVHLAVAHSFQRAWDGSLTLVGPQHICHGGAGQPLRLNLVARAGRRLSCAVVNFLVPSANGDTSTTSHPQGRPASSHQDGEGRVEERGIQFTVQQGLPGRAGALGGCGQSHRKQARGSWGPRMRGTMCRTH